MNLNVNKQTTASQSCHCIIILVDWSTQKQLCPIIIDAFRCYVEIFKIDLNIDNKIGVKFILKGNSSYFNHRVKIYM